MKTLSRLISLAIFAALVVRPAFPSTYGTTADYDHRLRISIMKKRSRKTSIRRFARNGSASMATMLICLVIRWF